MELSGQPTTLFPTHQGGPAHREVHDASRRAAGAGGAAARAAQCDRRLRAGLAKARCLGQRIHSAHSQSDRRFAGRARSSSRSPGLSSACCVTLVRRAGRYDLAHMLSSFAFWVTLFVGFLVVITVLLPSMRPVDIFTSLGIGSVALGFAFKDILQNWIAGFFILIRRPFHRGDQIKVGDIEGTVQAVETRATLVKTYSGRLVIIPNSDIYTRSVTVNTAYEHRRDRDRGAGRARGRSRSGDGGVPRGGARRARRAGGATARRPAVGVQRQQRQHPRALVDQVAAHLRGAHAGGGRIAVKQACEEAGIALPADTKISFAETPLTGRAGQDGKGQAETARQEARQECDPGLHRPRRRQRKARSRSGKAQTRRA